MTILATDFTSAFPEFANPAVYSISRINFWLGVATVQVNATRWGGLYNHGVYLLLAHFLTLAQSPGTVEGLDTGQTVDGVSYSTDVGSITITDAGLYNKTSYGIMFIQLSRKMGAGPVQFSY